MEHFMSVLNITILWRTHHTGLWPDQCALAVTECHFSSLSVMMVFLLVAGLSASALWQVNMKEILTVPIDFQVECGVIVKKISLSARRKTLDTFMNLLLYQYRWILLLEIKIPQRNGLSCFADVEWELAESPSLTALAMAPETCGLSTLLPTCYLNAQQHYKLCLVFNKQQEYTFLPMPELLT